MVGDPAHLAVLDHAQADGILAQAHEAARAVNRVQHPVPPCAAALRASCVYELQHLRVPRRIGSDMHQDKATFISSQCRPRSGGLRAARICEFQRLSGKQQHKREGLQVVVSGGHDRKAAITEGPKP